jgi:hypothetical protein
MARVWGRAREVIGPSVELALDAESIHGTPVDITNFDQYVLAQAADRLPINSLDDPAISEMTMDEIRAVQWRLVKAQLEFAYATTPAIKYLWDLHEIAPKQVDGWQSWRAKVPPITKAHQRLLGWMNFLPAPVAEYVLVGGIETHQVNPNLHIEKRKWTGGTSARHGSDHVYIIIPKADWRASVQTMVRIAKPLERTLGKSVYAATTYDRRHIAEPIFEDQLQGYGIHLLAKPAGSSDAAFYRILRENGVNILVAPPVDHPAKGQGIPGALKEVADQLDVVLMSSATPTEETLRTLAENKIAIVNVGGDTGSLPTYCSVVADEGGSIKESIDRMKRLRIIQLAPALTEIVNPTNLAPAALGTWGVLLQTNCAATWEDGRYVKQNVRTLWKPDGTSRLVPALKTQMIRSSATGNLVHVLRVDEDGIPVEFHHLILRYNDFEVGPSLRPILDYPRSSGGSPTGGCAA